MSRQWNMQAALPAVGSIFCNLITIILSVSMLLSTFIIQVYFIHARFPVFRIAPAHPLLLFDGWRKKY